MRETVRLRNRRYTDSDVLAFYIRLREERASVFFREVGDFIAHPIRERGRTLERTVYMFSQLAFIQTYKVRREELDASGVCGWWMKPFLLGKLARIQPRELIRQTGLTKAVAKEKIESWFPEDGPYPTSIDCQEPLLFLSLARLFSQFLEAEHVFSEREVIDDVRRSFTREAIPYEEGMPFLVASAVLLAGKVCEVLSDFSAETSVAIEHRPPSVELIRSFREFAGPVKETHAADAVLGVSVATKNHTGDGLANIVTKLFELPIVSSQYFDTASLDVDDLGRLYLPQATVLTFDRASEPMVTRLRP